MIAKEMKEKWSGSLDLNPKFLGQSKRSVIITSAASSTRIEGAKMTDSEVDRFLRGINQAIPKNRDEQEVAGYTDLLGRKFTICLLLILNWVWQKLKTKQVCSFQP